MKVTLILIALFLSLGSVASEQSCNAKNIRKFANEFAYAFKNESLYLLDKKYCLGTNTEVAFEHSIQDDDENIYYVKSFSVLNDLLNSRKDIGRYPLSAIWPLVECNSHQCSFGGNDVSQIHNHLFLKTIEYRIELGRVVITKILFEEGD